MNGDSLYDGREQTLVKHFILRTYLLRLALIVGPWSKAINYIDCFSGPWNVRGGNYEDSSFGVAITELRKARDKLAERSITLGLRCFFLEQDPSAYAKLEKFAQTISDIQIETRRKRLDDAVGDILSFHHRAGTAFPFVLIDPTGWTGFPLEVIRPLLQLKPGEVLINYMTWHARRFIETEHERHNFDDLYGDASWRAELAGLSADQRDDAMVRLYAERVRKAGGYAFVCYTPVLHREDDTTHFHLIYASRSEKGVEVFKDAERRAVAVMEKKRAQTQQTKRTASGQTLLLGAEEMHDPAYYSGLRAFYLDRAKRELKEALKRQPSLRYDEAWRLAMKHPLVWERDLKDWIAGWRKEGRLNIGGLSPKEEPKRGTHTSLDWR
ncbi:MAG: three-Cys-motif partner protein TcmP [Verrucomicrobiota bacterium]|jgi:three-Cys-motif partner protein